MNYTATFLEQKCIKSILIEKIYGSKYGPHGSFAYSMRNFSFGSPSTHEETQVWWPSQALGGGARTKNDEILERNMFVKEVAVGVWLCAK